jgi:hypothetical protein
MTETPVTPQVPAAPVPSTVIPAKPGRPSAAAIAAKVAATKLSVEKVNAGVTDDPLVDVKGTTEATPVQMCVNHPAVPAATYGYCPACYDKLPKMEKRRLYLDARLHGPNTHNYPGAALAVWRREMERILNGTWKRPERMISKSKLAQEIIG